MPHCIRSLLSDPLCIRSVTMKVVTEIQMLLLILALLSFHVFAPASQVLADVTLESRRSGYSSDLEDLGAAVFEDGISTDQLEQHHQSRSRNNESQRLQERELTVYDEVCLAAFAGELFRMLISFSA